MADFLGFPFYVVNFEQRFEADVVRPFVQSYLAGETPIPCTLCNNYIKFDHLLATAQQIGAERLATGHYCRVGRDQQTGRYQLRRARDAGKDQSYFLFGLTQEQLARTEFPLGELTKQQVRALARRKQLPVADKPESQEICFVPSGNYIGFIESYLAEQGSGLPPQKGELVTTDGKVLGEHKGLHQFTVGQRRGLGIAASKPLYVLALDRENNRVIVGDDADRHVRASRQLVGAGPEHNAQEGFQALDRPIRIEHGGQHVVEVGALGARAADQFLEQPAIRGRERDAVQFLVQSVGQELRDHAFARRAGHLDLIQGLHCRQSRRALTCAAATSGRSPRR